MSKTMGQAAATPRLLLLRHGQGMLGSEDYDRLSKSGQRQSALLGERLRADLAGGWPVWSGSLKRHRQTLESLAPSGAAFIDPKLNEYRVDQLMQSALAQAAHLRLEVPEQQAFADPVAYLDTFLAWFPNVLDRWQAGLLTDAANGTWAAFRVRALALVDLWKQELQGGRSVVVVTSAGIISTVVSELLGRGLAWQRELNVSLYNASVTELSLDARTRWQLNRINCVSHLEPHDLVTLA
ncbi:MAG: hypothetical protein EA419_07250 [Wenzhouxiangella sp.]|nr:MAG: hypothetical protein EA419_07250 [Wenzhouxiangella sp.]